MSTPSYPDLHGLILTGGRSSRMGLDKRTLSYHGLPQDQYLQQLLSPWCSQIFLSHGRNGQPESENDSIRDRFDWHGPLNGILSGLLAHPGKAILAVAVDMPGIDSELIQFLVTNRAAGQIATCFLNPETQKPEPLCAIYEPVAAQLIMEWVKSNKPSPRDFLMNHQPRILQWADTRVFLNINTPEDYRPYTGKQFPDGLG